MSFTRNFHVMFSENPINIVSSSLSSYQKFVLPVTSVYINLYVMNGHEYCDINIFMFSISSSSVFYHNSTTKIFIFAVAVAGEYWEATTHWFL